MREQIFMWHLQLSNSNQRQKSNWEEEYSSSKVPIFVTSLWNFFDYIGEIMFLHKISRLTDLSHYRFLWHPNNMVWGIMHITHNQWEVLSSSLHFRATSFNILGRKKFTCFLELVYTVVVSTLTHHHVTWLLNSQFLF